MGPTLRDYPHLPVLDIDKCLSVFVTAKISFTKLAELTGYSRQALYFWRKNKRAPLPHALDRVSTLAYKGIVQIRAKRLPLAGRPSIATIQAVFDEINLNEITVDVLPKPWREELTA